VKDVTKRLGCLRGGAGDVKAHRFFRGLDWEALTRKAVRPPWVPTLRHALDTSCFDEYDEDDDSPPLRGGGGGGGGAADDWDKDF
jgi:protein kinase A